MNLENLIIIICIIIIICLILLPFILINMCYGTYIGTTIDNELVKLKFVYSSYGSFKGTTIDDRQVILKEYKEIN